LIHCHREPGVPLKLQPSTETLLRQGVLYIVLVLYLENNHFIDTYYVQSIALVAIEGLKLKRHGYF
jgi:hypothetical protein